MHAQLVRINDIAGKLIGTVSFRALMIFYYSKAISLKEIEFQEY
ncbi:MAG: hypothetical protein QXO29_06690 [Nitrososphaerota archaeon]